MRPPALVFHADWSSADRGRRGARAVLEGGRYRASAPAPVGEPRTLLRRLRDAAAGDGSVLAGFDFPIGVPTRWAEAAGATYFRDLLLRLGSGEWSDFFEVARTPEEIDLRRPFYPGGGGAKGQHSRSHLTGRLGVAWDSLLRRCDRQHAHRRAASPLFWTLGGAQVGRAAISGWRDVLVPALRDEGLDVAVWPFDGDLDDLLAPGRVVVAETYPAAFYRELGIDFGRGSKRVAENRLRQAPRLLEAAERLGVEPSGDLLRELERGFEDDDAFDAVAGLFGMLTVVLGSRERRAPVDATVRRIEGWMLGQRDAAVPHTHAPQVRRPRFHPSYGISKDEAGLLPWGWATARLTEARSYWVCTTRPDSRPHAMPVWGGWLDDTLYFGTARESRKARNLARNPSVVVHLESADEVVILEGTVEEATDDAVLARVASAWSEKYAMKIELPTPGGAAYAVRPRVGYAWREYDYPESATQFVFEGG